MKTRNVLTTAFALAALVLTAPAFGADDDINELPEGIIAKLARMKSKTGGGSRRDRDNDASSSSASSAGCGSLNVGNVEAGKAGTRAPRQVIVVIEGPVVNANNKCR